MMSSHCPNLVAIGRIERILRHIRFRYPGGYRFVGLVGNGLKNFLNLRRRYIMGSFHTTVKLLNSQVLTRSYQVGPGTMTITHYIWYYQTTT